MSTPGPVRPGMALTADRLNSWLLPGRILFKATRDDAQTISSGTNPSASDALIWQTIELDELGGWSAAQPTRWTCARAGWYQLTGGVSFVGQAAGAVRAAAWLVNGSVAAAGHTRLAATASGTAGTVTARTLVIPLAVGDYVELAPGQSSGAALDTATGGIRPFIQVAGAREI